MEVKSIKQIKNLAGKQILLRVDYNVGLKKGVIIDDFRIERSLPTIKYLLQHQCQVILVSHLGRPKGRRLPILSLAPVARELNRSLKPHKVKFYRDKIDSTLASKVKNSRSQIIMLENLRFDRREEANDLGFAKVLASFADIYVNDAFAVCHRKATSVVAITKYLPSYAGINLVDEVHYLSKALKPVKPAVALIGGVKFDSKFGVLKNFLSKYNKVMVGGGIANLFLKGYKFEIGSSLYDQAYVSKAKRIKNTKLMTPIDFVIADKKTMKKIRYHQLKWGYKIAEPNEMILDIGPETIKKYALEIKKAKTIVWGGPMGYIDQSPFCHGSETLAKLIAARSSGRAVGIAGGGETIQSINRTKMAKYFDFISTGGGAMLEFLEGKKLPGLKPLVKQD